MNLVQRHSSRNMTNTCITIIEGDIALAVALSHNLKTETYRRKRRSRRGSLEKARRRASRSCLSRLDAVRRVGPEICTRLRAKDVTRMLPIIMLSARGEEVLRCAVFPPGG
jgi:two-component system, OmpR family, phosphate regulon response regulator PhoB